MNAKEILKETEGKMKKTMETTLREFSEVRTGRAQPALIEDKPRLLLRALAAGVPVIATPACGLPPQAGLTLVPEGDVTALSAAIAAVLPN